MKLVFLGTGGYHPNQRRHTAGVLLPSAGILFDAGSGMFRLVEHLQSPRLRIFLTHAHLDHILGLTYLLVPVAKRELETITLYGDAATLAAVRDHLFAEAVFPVMPPFEFVELPTAGVIALPDGLTVSHQELPSHPGGSRAFRINWSEGGRERSLAYITDTSADGSYLEFIRGTDMLIHECYFKDEMLQWGKRTGHCCTSQVAQVAADAGVDRLLLSHIDPQHPEDDPVDIALARSIFPHVKIAEDLMEIDV